MAEKPVEPKLLNTVDYEDEDYSFLICTNAKSAKKYLTDPTFSKSTKFVNKGNFCLPFIFEDGKIKYVLGVMICSENGCEQFFGMDLNVDLYKLRAKLEMNTLIESGLDMTSEAAKSQLKQIQTHRRIGGHVQKHYLAEHAPKDKVIAQVNQEGANKNTGQLSQSDQEILKILQTTAFTNTGLPFSITENESFKNWIRMIGQVSSKLINFNHGELVYGRKTLTTTADDMVNKAQLWVKQKNEEKNLQKHSIYFSASFDGWCSREHISFLDFTLRLVEFKNSEYKIMVFPILIKALPTKMNNDGTAGFRFDHSSFSSAKLLRPILKNLGFMKQDENNLTNMGATTDNCNCIWF